MQRYFAKIYDKEVLLSKDDAFHVTKVMRSRPGDQIEVVADDKVFLAEIESIKPLSIRVKKQLKEDNELPNKVILIVSLLKGDHMDMVIQKATELGVYEIVFLTTERTVVRLKHSDIEAKLTRYRRIAKEAAEQSKRKYIPTIYHFINIKDLKDIDADIKLVAYEGMQGNTDSFVDRVSNVPKNKKIAIIIGPEGGLSKSEVNEIMSFDYKKVGFGKRILRAETAAIYAMSVIASQLEKK